MFYRDKKKMSLLKNIFIFLDCMDSGSETTTSNSSDFQSFLDSGVGKLIFINLL